MAPLTTFIPCVIAAPRHHVPALRSSTMLGRPLFRLAVPLSSHRVHSPFLMCDPAAESSAPTPPVAEEPVAPAPAEEAVTPAPIAAVDESASTDAPPSVDAASEVSTDVDATVTASDTDAAAPATKASESAGTDDKAESDDDSDQPKRRRRVRPKRKVVTIALDDMTVGMELEGVVKGVTNYGAFVGDMGTATDGLLHVSQLAAGYIENVSDVVNIGDKVTVRVFAIDAEKKTFSLTMKTAEEIAAKSAQKESTGGRGRQSPAERKEEQNKKWETFSFDQMAFLDGKVLSITEFGAFCQLLNADGQRDNIVPTDGLIHISEISEERVENVSDVLTVDQIVKVRIVSTDRKRNRISLSLKQYSEKKENSGSGPNNYKREREDLGGSTDVVGDLARAMESQPTFKTSFQIAFEKARSE